MAVSELVNHFVTIKIDKNRLDFTATRMDGTQLDKFEIVKTKNGYNQSYKSKVIPQEKLNVITGFNSAVSQGLSIIPLKVVPDKYSFEIQPDASGDIPFTIDMVPEAKAYYSMKPYSGTLKSNAVKKVS